MSLAAYVLLTDNRIPLVGFEFPVVVPMKGTVFRDVAPCSRLEATLLYHPNDILCRAKVIKLVIMKIIKVSLLSVLKADIGF
jgi:hypothetical protein